ncbi:RNA helicase [Malassezia sp. CBS 17886]|nr:RNA helicase [Malassezia sp. CBS 17886]
MIGITQPRRVAAVSMARRVAQELARTERHVSHQIRYDATVSPHTQIKFMTDGVLLRELAQDFLLSKYSVIIVDEAHERSVNTDVLIGILSRVVRLRADRWMKAAPGSRAARPLRMVIMSATLRVSDFAENPLLFASPPPVVHIAARQHPVTIHFNRRTVQDYVSEAVKKAAKIHARLPPGGILIFVTGQQEVQTVCRKLAQGYGDGAYARASGGRVAAPSARIADVEAEEVDLGEDRTRGGAGDGPAADDEGAAAADDDALDTSDEESRDGGADTLPLPTTEPMHILPLYSRLPSHEQERVFDPTPAHKRLVVVATNVAETSITIPHIRYVVDCGRAKERRLHGQSQMQSYDVAWISKASAAQRAGRAGRTGPGHCYRLYSSAVYEEHFAEFGVPEILRTPVEGLVLQMKAMNVDQVANFPFPTAPDRDALRRAERMLLHLGALAHAEGRAADGRRTNTFAVTELGRTMAVFPVLPRYAKLLAQGNQHGCLSHAVALVAALSVGDVFEREDVSAAAAADGMDAAAATEARRAARASYYRAMRAFDTLGDGQSDAFRLLNVVGAYSHDAAAGASLAFCERHHVRQKAMEEIHKLRAQLSQIVLANHTGVAPAEERRLQAPVLAPPSATQCKVLRQLLAAIYVDRVAVRADVVGAPVDTHSAKPADARGIPYVALGIDGPVYIHASSTFFQRRPPPEWVVFGEVHQAAAKEAVVDADAARSSDAPPRKAHLQMLTRINPGWIASLGRSLCTFSQPSSAEDAAATRAQLSGSIQQLKSGGRSSQELEREVLVAPRYGGAIQDGAASQGVGWELPPLKVKQVFRQGRWTTVQ